MEKVVILKQKHYDSIVTVLCDVKIDAKKLDPGYIRGGIVDGIDYVLEILESED